MAGPASELTPHQSGRHPACRVLKAEQGKQAWARHGGRGLWKPRGHTWTSLQQETWVRSTEFTRGHRTTVAKSVEGELPIHHFSLVGKCRGHAEAVLAPLVSVSFIRHPLIPPLTGTHFTHALVTPLPFSVQDPAQEAISHVSFHCGALSP